MRRGETPNEGQKDQLRKRGAQVGQPSRNPKGRPKQKLELKARCATFTDEVIDLWVACMRDEGARWADRLRASEHLANRAHGMPTQQHTVDVQHTLGITSALEAMNARRLARTEPIVIEATPVEEKTTR